jgi:hypothetical protein
MLCLLGVLACAFLLYVFLVYRDLKLQTAAANRETAELEANFRAQLVQYQRALPIGTPRSEVLKYLKSQKVDYFTGNRREINVDLGREPDVFPCDYWMVYASLDFGRSQTTDQPAPQDLLAAISLKRIGHCP